MRDDRSLELYQRGRFWWVKGRRPDNDRYIRESLGTPDEAVAAAKLEEIYREARKRRILGPDAPRPEDALTFADCARLYDAPAREAEYLIPIVRRIGKTKVRELTPAYVKALAKQQLPFASSDTWQRQVVTPIRAVINNAHELGRCPPIRVAAFTREERERQDRLRGKDSRQPRVPGSWPWLLAFVDHATERDAALAYFMFRHGYRIGQSIAMTRSKDMDLGRSRVRVHGAKGLPAHWVELDPEEVAMIANIPVPYRGAASDRVFCISGGRSGALYRRWRETCERAGIEYLPPHQAGRHGYGTEMIVRRKVDPVTAADKRWASPAVMLKTYAHPEDSEAIVREAFTAGRTLAVQARNEMLAKSRARKRK